METKRFMKMQDVARAAHVGVGTVSRVLNNTGYVSEETRRKVEKAIEELHYTPNELARNLYHKKTQTIAVIVPEISNPFYAWVVDTMEKRLRWKGYRVLLCNTIDEQTNEALYLQMLQRNMVDGVLTMTHTLDNSLYASLKGPVVSIDTPQFSEEIPVVSADHAQGGCAAAELLLNSGCKHIFQFCDNIDEAFPYFARHDEFAKTVAAAGVSCGRYFAKWNQFSVQYFLSEANQFFDEHPEADGIFGTDMWAAACLRVAQERGLHVPEDLKIVSYDGTYLAKLSYPRLTVIQQPVEQIVETSVDLLVRRIEGEKFQNLRINVPIQVIRGATTL